MIYCRRFINGIIHLYVFFTKNMYYINAVVINNESFYNDPMFHIIICVQRYNW